MLLPNPKEEGHEIAASVQGNTGGNHESHISCQPPPKHPGALPRADATPEMMTGPGSSGAGERCPEWGQQTHERDNSEGSISVLSSTSRDYISPSPGAESRTGPDPRHLGSCSSSPGRGPPEAERKPWEAVGGTRPMFKAKEGGSQAPILQPPLPPPPRSPARKAWEKITRRKSGEGLGGGDTGPGMALGGSGWSLQKGLGSSGSINTHLSWSDDEEEQGSKGLTGGIFSKSRGGVGGGNVNEHVEETGGARRHAVGSIDLSRAVVRDTGKTVPVQVRGGERERCHGRGQR
ncbi:unnamed protein product [Discosporangium mesarthrocarpum]